MITVTCVTDDKAHYYTDASTFMTKLIADKATHKLLGIQVLGAGAVDKMVDIAVTGIAMGAKVEDFDTLDFAYAPPFSTAIHPFVQACYILENKMSGEYQTMTPAQYAATKAKGYKVIDVSPAPSIPGAQWIDLAKVTGPIDGLDLDAKLLLVLTALFSDGLVLMCVTIGSIVAKKHKLLAGIGIYYGVSSVITFLAQFVSLFTATSSITYLLMLFMGQSSGVSWAGIALQILSFALAEAVLACVFHFTTLGMIERKLNLP